MTDYWDELLPGFGVRVSQSGRKVYVVRYRLESKRRRETLGSVNLISLADARAEARSVLRRASLGVAASEDAAGEAKRRLLTFDELATEYLEKHAKQKKRSWREDERQLNVDLLPRWRDRQAEDITRRDIVELLDSIVERGSPIAANRMKALISKIFNFGIGRDLVVFNPAQGVAMPAKPKQRDRVLTESEIRAVWQALDCEDPVMAATFKIRLLTAQRGVEVLSMRWDEINESWWTIPGDIAKNGLSHRVPLSDPVNTLLMEIRPLTIESGWVFASPKRPDAPIRWVQKTASRIAQRAGVEFVPHDLRRTAASFMTSLGVSRLVVSKVLNHAETGVTAVYDRHSYDGEKEDALTLWGEKLTAILGDHEASESTGGQG